MKARTLTRETIRDLGVNNKRTLPAFEVGDVLNVSLRIKEGDKERIQQFQGNVIAIHNHGASSTFTVRKIGAHGVAVERVLPFHSPLIKDIEVQKKGDVRRAKLYYVRRKIGRGARIDEKVTSAAEANSTIESAK